MTPAERSAFAALLSDVLGFYGQASSPFALSVWWEACKAMELQSVRAAMTAYATDPDRGHFPPKPADLIRIVQGSTSDAALQAWTDVLEQVRGVGSYGSPILDAVQRAALAGIGGWTALCRSNESELPHLQRRFVEYFVAEGQRQRRVALLGSASLRLAVAPSDDDSPTPERIDW